MVLTTYGNDGWAAKVRLPAYRHAEVTVDPTEAFGQPLLMHGGARLEDLDRFKAGNGFADIAADFGVPGDEVEDVIRVALRLPLEFFVDHSLGRYIVTDALRDAGAIVHPMAEVYGERVGQGLADTEWLRDAAANGWVVLMKDDKIRYRPAELGALTAGFLSDERQSGRPGDCRALRCAAFKAQ